MNVISIKLVNAEGLFNQKLSFSSFFFSLNSQQLNSQHIHAMNAEKSLAFWFRAGRKGKSFFVLFFFLYFLVGAHIIYYDCY